jgi:TonB-linked SusC/RagA family outer membrane protein
MTTGFKIILFILGLIPFSNISLIAQESFAIKIKPDTTLISNGYNNQSIRDLPGAVSVIQPSDLTESPAGNLTSQLQGRAAGVNVIGNGQPGVLSRIRIRGFASFINNEPLYIVDGVPSHDISFLNPNDVESAVFLKEGGAAAIYGSRASNGVIVINTRHGGTGLKVSYNMFLGKQLPGKGTSGDVLNTKEYGDLQWLEYKNDGITETHPIYGSSLNPSPAIPSWAGDTDWYDAITQSAGIQNHDLTFSGGNDNSKFYAGFGAFIQNGIIKKTGVSRYSARINSEFNFLKKRVKFGENFNAAFKRTPGEPNLDELNPVQTGPYRSQAIIPVTVTVPVTGQTHDFVAGDWGGTGMAPRLGISTNPVADLTRNSDDLYWQTNLTGNIYIDIKIIEGLNFRSSIGGTFNYGYGIDYTGATYENAINTQVSSLQEGAFYKGDWVWTNLLNLVKQYGKHYINAVAGYEALQSGHGRELTGERSDYFSEDPDFRTLSNGAIIEDAASFMYTPVRTTSWFANAGYNYSDRYFLNAGIRRDGCSKFSEENRFGIFPSVTAAWRLSGEQFMKSTRGITDLKLRASYGVTGNQQAISPYSGNYLFSADIRSSYYDIYGTFNSSVQGFYPSTLPNPDAKWETNRSVDIGFDSWFFDNSLGLKFDWFSSIADDLLSPVENPATGGTASASFANVGAMSNKGVEVELAYRKSWSNFGISTRLLFSAYRNKVNRMSENIGFVEGGNTNMGNVVRNMEGKPVSDFYGYQVYGIFKSQAEVDMAPYQDAAEPGLLRFENQDTLTTVEWSWVAEKYIRRTFIDYRDKTSIGNPNPAFTYGFDLTLKWKNFDLGAFFYGSQGNEIFNYNKWWIDFWPSFQGQKSKELLYNSWTTSNVNATVPKATNKSNFSTNTQVCSYYIENGSYLRLKSLQAGYTLPAELTNKAGIGSLRVYLLAVNLFTITGYSGLDPEIGGPDMGFGIDYGNYPQVKQFIFGINLAFR